MNALQLFAIVFIILMVAALLVVLVYMFRVRNNSVEAKIVAIDKAPVATPRQKAIYRLTVEFMNPKTGKLQQGFVVKPAESNFPYKVNDKIRIQL